MSCPRERDLALYVENDLPAVEALALQEHVLGCDVCRRFLLDLEASQRALKELAEAPIADEAFAELRRRAVMATAAPRESHVARWAIAATVAALATVGLIVAVASRAPDQPKVAVVPAPSRAGVPSPEPPVAAVAPTPEPVRPVVRRRPVPEPPFDATGMTPEQTDQFVRALVAVSKIESLEDVERPSPEPTTPPLVRIASDDPNVAIYWRLEPTGGK